MPCGLRSTGSQAKWFRRSTRHHQQSCNRATWRPTSSHSRCSGSNPLQWAGYWSATCRTQYCVKEDNGIVLARAVQHTVPTRLGHSKSTSSPPKPRSSPSTTLFSCERLASVRICAREKQLSSVHSARQSHRSKLHRPRALQTRPAKPANPSCSVSTKIWNAKKNKEDKSPRSTTSAHALLSAGDDLEVTGTPTPCPVVKAGPDLSLSP